MVAYGIGSVDGGHRMSGIIGLFPGSLLPWLENPTVICTVLARLYLYDGVARLHAGYGSLEVDGDVYLGVSDPGQTRMVQVSAIEEPRPGVASKITLTLSGVDAGFIRTVRSDMSRVEGRRADLMITFWDPATREAIGKPVVWFPYGTMTSPSIRFARPGARDFSLTIESIWSARNFSPAGQISDSDQRRRSPGDSACRNVGGNHIEKWPVNDS